MHKIRALLILVVVLALSVGVSVDAQYRLKLKQATTGNTTPEPPGNTGSGGTDFLGYRPQLYTSYGMNTVGGRGASGVPVIIRVNTLSDTGAALSAAGGSGTTSDPYIFTGELRAALSRSGPRFIVFDVSGYIALNSAITNVQPYVTIAGQTAPAPGITLRNFGIEARNTHDVVLQHFRIRPGWNGSNCGNSWTFYNTMSTVYNLVFDHMSVSWGQDENWDLSVQEANVEATFWRSITSESLSDAPGSAVCTGGSITDPPPEHGHGMLIGAGNKHVAVLQSLFAHNRERNPYWQAGTTGIIANSIIFDWYQEWGIFLANRSEWGVSDRRFHVSAIGNRFIRGPHTVNPGDANEAWMFYYDAEDNNAGSEIYRSDNTLTNDSDNKVTTQRFDPDMLYDPNVSTPPTGATVPAGYTILNSTTIESTLLPIIGARPKNRDSVDTRIITETTNRTHAASWYAADESDVGGFPTLANNTRTYPIPANPFAVASGQSVRTNLEMDLESKAVACETSSCP